MLKKTYPLLFIVVLLAASCSKKSGTSSGNTDPVTPVKPTPPADIYVLGKTSAGNVYWKNGVATPLTGFSGYTCTGIAVSGTDVYVTGNIQGQNSNYVAAYWKNGVVTTLTDGTQSTQATGVAVSGTDVYISGFAVYPPITINGTLNDLTGYYWKNGVATTLTGVNAIGQAITVNGTDVYVAGSVGLSAAYWKNNVSTNLSDGSEKAEAYAIQVSNNNVYTLGWVNISPGTASSNYYFWKNTTQVSVNTVGQFVVSGTDIYTTGFISAGNAAFWKNGTATALPAPPNQYFTLTGMAVNGSDVYVSENVGYWKNTTFVPLTGCTNTIEIIAVPQ